MTYIAYRTIANDRSAATLVESAMKNLYRYLYNSGDEYPPQVRRIRLNDLSVKV